MLTEFQREYKLPYCVFNKEFFFNSLIALYLCRSLKLSELNKYEYPKIDKYAIENEALSSTIYNHIFVWILGGVHTSIKT